MGKIPELLRISKKRGFPSVNKILQNFRRLNFFTESSKICKKIRVFIFKILKFVPSFLGFSKFLRSSENVKKIPALGPLNISKIFEKFSKFTAMGKNPELLKIRITFRAFHNFQNIFSAFDYLKKLRSF